MRVSIRTSTLWCDECGHKLISLTYCTYLFLCVTMSHYAPVGIKNNPQWYQEMHYTLKQKVRYIMPQLIWVETLLCTWGIHFTNRHTVVHNDLDVNFLEFASKFRKTASTRVTHYTSSSVFLSNVHFRWRGLRESPRRTPAGAPDLKSGSRGHDDDDNPNADETETETKHSPTILTVGGIREVGSRGGNAKPTGPK